MYGNPETTTGGNALKYYASVRLEIKRVEGLKGDGEDIGNHVRVRILKTRLHLLSEPQNLTLYSERVFAK